MADFPLRVLVTVDLENPQTPVAEGRCKSSLLRPNIIEPLIEVFDQFGVKAVFFASVFDGDRFGLTALQETVARLIDQGQDVQLHTHPYWRFGKPHMWQYSLAEQSEIIRQGKALLADWTGTPPVAHRAGAYGANRDTLKALLQNSFRVDASMFPGHKNCKLPWTSIGVAEYDGILEIPVTTYSSARTLRIAGLPMVRSTISRKTDIDWCTRTELIAFLNTALTCRLPLMTLFLHSYSIYRFNTDYEPIGINQRILNRLTGFLESCRDTSRITFITTADLLRLWEKNPESLSAFKPLPAIERTFSVNELFRSALRSVRIHR